MTTSSLAYDIPPPFSGPRAIAWACLSPIRAYLRSFPFPRGKGVLLRSLILPVLPVQGRFDVRLPGGAVIPFGYHERLGLAFLLRGEFELAEVRAAIEHARPGSTAFDIGSNVGLFALALGPSVGAAGRVVAIEPLAENVERINSAASRSGIANVQAMCCAAGAESGVLSLYLADDTAFTSFEKPKEGGGERQRDVDQKTVDQIWESLGNPTVTFVKVDVEGAEINVLRGASRMIAHCQPTLLLEANTTEQLERITAVLGPAGYVHTRPAGFEPWNYLFKPRATTAGI